MSFALRLAVLFSIASIGSSLGCSGAPATGAAGDAGSGGSGAADSGGAGGSTGGSATSGSGGSVGSGGSGGSSSGSGGDLPGCTIDMTKGVCVAPDACVNAGVAVPGYCMGTPGADCCVHDPIPCDPMVKVLPNGGIEEAPGMDGCPAGMVKVDTFCVDRYEGSLQTLDGAAWSPFFNPGSTKVKAVSIEGAVPQAYISGTEAEAACKNAGKRLCSNDEWLRACQGPQKTTYPYGNTDEPGVCNDHRSEHPVIEYYGTDASWIWTKLDNACIDQLHDTVDRSGARASCVTAEGAYDMMGNLHEWTSDPAGTFRGGYYVDTVINGKGCLYATTFHPIEYWDYSTGFRCCADLP